MDEVKTMKPVRKKECPPYHWKNSASGECELRKYYQLNKKKDNPNIRIMPQGLRDLLTDEEYENNYVKKAKAKGLEIEIVDDKHNITKKKKEEIKVNKTKKIRLKIVKELKKNEKDKKQDARMKIKNWLKTKLKVKIPSPEKSLESKSENNANDDTYDKKYLEYLYPNIDDKRFNAELIVHKEFRDTKFDGSVKNIEEEANRLCNVDFELMPHQIFVKNFLSFNTPYNNLLLYHGLGSGKTCSAIGITEEIRKYMKQINLKNSIIVIATPNVQDNFKLQLFDERKLVQEDGIWNLNTCVGNALLKEVNPSSLKNLPRQQLVSQIKSMINKYYVFMGYNQFANFITYKTNTTKYDEKQRKQMKIAKIKALFDNKLIVIDEFHNLRINPDNSNMMKTAELLMEVAKYTDNMRLLLLSATPMFNTHEEVIWMTNLMSINDGKSLLQVSDVFDKKGEFKEDGENTLTRKLNGYISYVRGENPYLFAARIYAKNSDWNKMKYGKPEKQMNGKVIKSHLKQLQNILFYNDIGTYQGRAYEYIMRFIYEKNESDLANLETSFGFVGYALLQKPIEALNIVYPNADFDNIKENILSEDSKNIISEMIGKNGLDSVMKYKKEGNEKPMKYEFEYKYDKYGKIFSLKELLKYSAKMHQLCECVKQSSGIILIYSQFIEGGVVPMALALEEMGFARYCSESTAKSLLKNPAEPLDAISLKPKSEHVGKFQQAKYVMITGDKTYSPNNDADIKFLNSPQNKYGEHVKVVIISKAAAEGIDFKNIRQIHVLEPWYNMNRIEQIIGRGVRNLAHCMLPFEERNVEIFLHSTILPDLKEAIDMYIYRLAEQKSIKIGKVTRLMKEISNDCHLNIEQNNFNYKNLLENSENRNILCRLPNGKIRNIELGNKPHTDICDYMDNCQYKCRTNPPESGNVKMTTYNENFMEMNENMIIKRIKDLFLDIPGAHKGKFFYKRNELINSINASNNYPLESIYDALNKLINNPNEIILDNYGRVGNLVNKGEYYFFQPREIRDTNASVFDKMNPVDVKMDHVNIAIPEIKIRENSNEHAQYKQVLAKLKTDFDDAFASKEKEKSGEKGWIQNISSTVAHMTKTLEIPLEDLKHYVFSHLMDCIPYLNKVTFLNKLNEEKGKGELEEYIMKYFNDRIILIDENNLGIVMLDEDDTLKYLVERNNTWKPAEFTDVEKFLRSSEYTDKYVVRKAQLNSIFGFMSWKKEQCNFKVRDLNDKRNNRGAILHQALTKDIIVKINSILNKQIYTLGNIKETNEKGKTIATCVLDGMKYDKNKMVVITEMVLRHYQNTSKNSKIWYIDSEKIAVNKILEYKKN